MVEAMSTVEFLDPCDDLLTFMSTEQTGVTDDYSGVTKFFTLNPFEIEKAVCIPTVVYTCSVVGPDSANYDFLCTGFDGTLASNNLSLTASYSDLDVVGGNLPAGDYTFTITATTQYGA